MENVEDRDLENFLVKKDDPVRVKSSENLVKRVAKLTGRTISSLRKKIKENKIDRAYAKYNKKYKKMQDAAEVASSVRKAQNAGEDITDSELAVEYSIVASYDKKLAKLGAKLLKDDIKKVAAGMDVSNVASIGKRIKVPRFLLTKMRKLVKAVEKIKTKKEQKRLTKVMTKQTKEYIKSSLDGAVFKEDGSLQEKINSEVIRDLGIKGREDGTERRLDTLRGFISLDGKSALFEKKRESDDELEKESKPKTDLPPVEPEPTVGKGEEKVNVNDLLKDFEKKNELTKQEKYQRMMSEIDAGLEEDYKNREKKEELKASTFTEENTPIKKPNNRQKEVEEILNYNNKINQLSEALKTTEDPEVKEVLSKEIEKAKAELGRIAGQDPKEELQNNNLNEESNKREQDIESEVKEEKRDMEPIVITPKNEEKSNPMKNVEVKNPEPIRASQVSRPVALRVTPQDIKKLEERNKAAQLKIVQLKAEKAQLEQEKAMLQEYIAQARMTKAAELEVVELGESIAPLRGEVAELNSQAAAIHSSLGK